MMKRYLNLVLFLFIGLVVMAQLPKLTVEQHLEDYDFAVKYIEDNYAGFPNKVVDSTRADYESMKTRLHTQVSKGERTGWDAVAEYTAWFNDYHTRLCLNDVDSCGRTRGASDKYRLQTPIRYDELMGEYRPQPVACKVTDKTFLVRFPSCYGDIGMEWIENSISKLMDSGCENLILDIRGNPGGSDLYWNPYWRLLADHDGEICDVEFRNSSAYRDSLLQELNSQGVPGEIIQGVQSIFPMLENIQYVPGSVVSQFLVKLTGGQDFSFAQLQSVLNSLAHPELISGKGNIHLEQVSDAVRRAALIIDNRVASSGEALVECLKATSNRTTVYGRDNTEGCFDFSNCNQVPMPNSGIDISVPMSRRVGLPETGIDATGIAPDVRIDLPLPAKLTDNIDEWVIWVAEQLEK